MAHLVGRLRVSSIRSLCSLGWTVAAFAGFCPHPTSAAQPADVDLVLEGLGLPVDIVAAPDGVGRFFVVDSESGRIYLVQDQERRPTPFFEFAERRLLSFALPPDFPRHARAYVSYISPADEIVLSRFEVDTASLTARPESEVVLLTIAQRPRHPCGDVEFGPDGMLYMCIGDPEPIVDNFMRAQTPESLEGKIIRIDVSDLQGDEAYAVPDDNPFASADGDAVRAEIWAYGLRNPWRFTFDPTDGTLYIPDVGEDHWEELNVVSSADFRSANFGWPMSEGNFCITECPESITWPLIDYPHLDTRCAIIGGGVYRGEKPEWHGVYVFGDYCEGTLWALRSRTDGYQLRQLLEGGHVIPIAIGTDSQGELLIADQAASAIHHLILPDDAEDGWEAVDSFLLRNQILEKRAGVSLHRDVLERMRNSRRWRWSARIAQLYKSLTEPLQRLYNSLTEPFEE